MAKIGLIDVDGHNFPNLPLMKLATWHRSKGNTVEWYDNYFVHYDVVYVAKVFTNTPDYAYHINADEVVYGGAGYDKRPEITVRSRLPPKIENTYPAIEKTVLKGCDLLYYILVTALLACGLYSLVTAFIRLPTRGAHKVVSKLKKKPGGAEQIYTLIVYPLSKLLSVFIRIDDYKKVRLKRNLTRANINLTPEEYYAKAVVTAALIISAAFLFIPLGIPILTMAMLALGIIMFFKEIQTVDDKLKSINSQILKELPRFIRTYNNSCASKVSVVDVIEKYAQIAGKDFKYDLDILITDLKTGNEEAALQKFDDRVNIPQLSTFVSGVIGTGKGIDQKTFFYLMEQDMKVLAKENLKKEIAKRPAKIRKATIAVGIMLFVIYLYPIALDLKNGLGIFN